MTNPPGFEYTQYIHKDLLQEKDFNTITLLVNKVIHDKKITMVIVLLMFLQKKKRFQYTDYT